MKRILALLLITICFSACEKDDICAEETTPRLILEFYDVTNPTVKKNISSLKVTGFTTDAVPVPLATPLATFTGVSKIELPLRITEDVTKYKLILNSASPVNMNEDILQFDYTRQNVYVSRACGFKTIFTLNSPIGVTRTDSNTIDGFWMQFINIQTTNIDTENEVHIKVFF